MANLIFSGVLERHPTVQFVSVESGVGWIPYAASGVGCLVGGGLSSWLLRRGATVNRARKLALGLSAAFMPWVN